MHQRTTCAGPQNALAGSLSPWATFNAMRCVPSLDNYPRTTCPSTPYAPAHHVYWRMICLPTPYALELNMLQHWCKAVPLHAATLILWCLNAALALLHAVAKRDGARLPALIAKGDELQVLTPDIPRNVIQWRWQLVFVALAYGEMILTDPSIIFHYGNLHFSRCTMWVSVGLFITIGVWNPHLCTNCTHSLVYAAQKSRLVGGKKLLSCFVWSLVLAPAVGRERWNWLHGSKHFEPPPSNNLSHWIVGLSSKLNHSLIFYDLV